MKLLFIIDNLQFFRDVFRSSILPRLLADPDAVVAVATTYHPDTLLREFQHPRLRVYPLTIKWPSLPATLAYSLAKDIYTIEHPEGSFTQKRLTEARQSGRRSLALRLGCSRALRKLAISSKRLTTLAERWGGDRQFGRILDQEKPALVFFSTMLPGAGEWLRAARRRGVPLVLSVAGWDHPTSKGPLPVVPDYSLVWTEEMRREMEHYHGLPCERIFPVGVIYFERYFQTEALMTRETFCASLNIPATHKLLHYATGDSKLIRCNQEFIRVIQRLIASGKLGQPCHLLVRVSPKDVFSLYREFEGMPHVTVQYPEGEGTLYGGHKWLPGPGEDHERASTLKNSDVVLSVSSSMMLDACCFDVPVINLAYDAGMSVQPWESVKRFFAYAHCQPALAENATWLVHNDEELFQALKTTLITPEAKRAERRQLLDRLVGFTDGKSQERWVEQITAIGKQHSR